jgi:hypothetical protein
MQGLQKVIFSILVSKFDDQPKKAKILGKNKKILPPLKNKGNRKSRLESDSEDSSFSDELDNSYLSDDSRGGLK